MPDENLTMNGSPSLTGSGSLTMYSTRLPTTLHLLSITDFMTGRIQVTSQIANATEDDPLMPCATRLQTMQERLNTSSSGVLSMIAIAGVSTLCAWSLFIYACWLIGENSQLWLKKGNYMMTISMYPVLSSLAFLGLLFPAASLLCQSMDTSYSAVVLWKLARSMVAGFGGKDGLVRIAAGAKVSLRSPPCCCCCVCLPTKDVSRRLINGAMALLLQCLFVRPMLMAIVAVLWINGTYDPSPLSNSGAFWFVTTISTASFLFAMYGLLLLLRVTGAHLAATLVAGRFFTVVLVILSTTIANFTINIILVATGVIRCTVYAPASQIANGYYHFAANLLILVFCIAAVSVYIKASRMNAKTTVKQRDSTEQQHETDVNMA